MKDVMRRIRIHRVVWTTILVVALGLCAPSNGQAQIGFSAYMGGALPTGDFGRTDVNRTPPKSGAESGHAFGGELAWGYRFTRDDWSEAHLHPAFVLTLGYSETEFGNDVPSSFLSDQPAVIITPESRIRMRSLRLGLRIIPWTNNVLTPTAGLGYERGKMEVDNWSFFGPSSEAGDLSGHTPIRAKLETENISGVFFQAGVATSAKKTAIFYADVMYHLLFSEGVATISEFTIDDEISSEDGTIKSDFQWWELRGGLIFFIGE